MRSIDVLTDSFERVRDAVHGAVEGLSPDDLSARAEGEANSVAWLVWHLTRVQDDHVSEVAGQEQAWLTDGWADRFGLPFDPADTGYGHTSDEVAAVRVESGDELLGYYDAVHARTLAFVAGIEDGDLDKVVDKAWDPPVTLGVRLVSVIADDLQHAGQAAFVRGVALRRDTG
ncbi:mycothiol transferase [Streptomyces sp. H27-D2]|uniref:mycothiol transferase n=1 Tax=Streptomyces sp. H27-D2 TaxID=3046304 RepID=UPI002DBFA3D7|nr:DinB family protein [Streptomyces sp. H27-D2]MEC4018635.1 DinB family protein [Streptomyces sp. H27-D2]